MNRIRGEEGITLVEMLVGLTISGIVLTTTLIFMQQQQILFATGSEDAILERSRLLASATPHGDFVELPDRHHFNAPGSQAFRQAAVGFFTGEH